ncbi:uncharacterized protein [Macrobrachium rosenbergii]|uniref:uncharacterized protein n=1 Tax=Macrobrachium rosenbergii TaxID=79674 RepID=UPI0034D40773
MCKKFKCSARAITIDDNIEKESGDHNHAGDGAKVEAARVQEKVRLLSALAFVPVFKVEETFEYLIENEVFPVEIQSVVDSFEDTWIGRPHRNNRRPAPFFKHELWNCFDYVKEEMPKTNNAVEGLHYGFEQQLSACHPSIWKFIQGLQREQSLQELRIEQYLGGVGIPVRKKKYRDCAKRLQTIVINYDEERPVEEYLRSVAYNISF